MARIAPTSTANAARSSSSRAARNAASNTAAVRARVRNKQSGVGCRAYRRARRRPALGGGKLLAGASEAAFAPPVRGERRFERGTVEIGPERVGEVQLGIRELPEQEIADALLAAGANEQVGLGSIVHRQVGGQVRFLDFVFCPGRIV